MYFGHFHLTRSNVGVAANMLKPSTLVVVMEYIFIEGSLEVKLRPYGQMKSRGGKSQRREEKKKEEQRRERVRRKKVQVREKWKVAKRCNFQWFVAPAGRKVGSLKRRVWSHLARWDMKNCTPMWRQAHFEVNMYKAYQVRSTFRSWDVEKVYVFVTVSWFQIKMSVQSASVSDRFWKLRRWKSARRWGAKHI